ncbi:MAG: MFS transporter [Fuerstiella sp.]
MNSDPNKSLEVGDNEAADAGWIQTAFRFVQVRPDERVPFSWACVWFATLLGGYYMVRPVRDALGSVGGGKELNWLFSAVFITMLIVVPLYSQLVSRFRRRIFVPIVYRFLMSHLLLFALALKFLDASLQLYVARVFFVWVSVYVLFAMSLFWSVMADSFSSDQGKRLFGIIAGCGTMGALLGSAFAGYVAKPIGIANLLLFPALLMEIGLWCYRRLEASRTESQVAAQQLATGGNPFAGFLHVLKSPYLLSICGYILLTALCGTSLYLTQANILNETYPDPDARVAVFAWIDFSVQSLTVALQLIVAGYLMKFSLPLTLAVLPTMYLLSFVALGFYPTFWAIVPAVVVTRAVVYGITVPAQGVLFTVVSREDKYKAKNVIDTVVTRGGDAVVGQLRDQLKTAGVAMSVVSWAMVPVAVIWVGLAWMLGCNGLKRAGQQSVTSAE